MLTSNMYSIEATEDIASKIRILAEQGVFSAKGGSIELHFDIEGNISQIVRHTYHRLSTSKVVAPG